MFDNANFPFVGSMSPRLPTVGSMMRGVGYYTAYKGKWHLAGELEPEDGRDHNYAGDMERYGFADITDVIIYSHEVGLKKPDPRVYALTGERLGVAPREVVFLDDGPQAVQGARAAGWQAVLFQDTRQAIADVEACLTR
jgi:arylsulfatase A-like enzyme